MTLQRNLNIAVCTGSLFESLLYKSHLLQLSRHSNCDVARLLSTSCHTRSWHHPVVTATAASTYEIRWEPPLRFIDQTCIECVCVGTNEI